MLCCGGTRKSRSLQKHSNPSTEQSIIAPSVKSGSILSHNGKGMNRMDSVKSLLLTDQWASGKNIGEEKSIMEHIFSFLTTNELLKMRLVSKQWNGYACEVLRNKMEGVIILQRGLEYYTKVMGSSIEVPIGRIFLNILDMDVPQPKRFFQSVGHSIYYLVLNLEGHSVPQFQSCLHYLRNIKQLSINLFNELGKDDKSSLTTTSVRRKTASLMHPTDIQILIEDYDETNNNIPFQQHLPKLESIIMSCESNWKNNEPFLLDQLIRGTPNLKNLNLKKWPFPLRGDLFEKPSLDNLQFLTVGYLTKHDLEVLASKRLHLKTTEFQLDYDVERETLDLFLESVSQTIEYIQVESKSNKNLVFRVHTKMPYLLTLRLTYWVGPIWLDTVAGNCENLMKIQLSNCDPSCLTVKHPKSNGNVKYLAANFGNFSTVSAKIRSQIVKDFIYSFPQLESFMMRQVADKVLGQIVEGWPKLKTLRVTSVFGLTDSGLTGIPVAELSKMTKLENKLSCGCCLPVPVVDSMPYVDNVRQYPHIGRLANLEDLSIESEEGSHFPLTNFSLHLGVHELKKLHSLKITCHNELGPHWCLRCIADNLPNLKELTVMDRAVSLDRYEEHEVLYLLRKLPNLKLHLQPTKVDHHHST